MSRLKVWVAWSTRSRQREGPPPLRGVKISACPTAALMGVTAHKVLVIVGKSTGSIEIVAPDLPNLLEARYIPRDSTAFEQGWTGLCHLAKIDDAASFEMSSRRSAGVRRLTRPKRVDHAIRMRQSMTSCPGGSM